MRDHPASKDGNGKLFRMRSLSKDIERNGAKARIGRARPLLTVRRRPLDPAQGLLVFDGSVFRCALGRSGIAALKREGDGMTPQARMRVLGGYFRADGAVRQARRAPGRLVQTRRDLGWCDAPDDRNYNRPVTLPYPAGHERMLRDDRLYDVCIVLDWNVRPRRRGAGSAIFMHIARPGLTPTEGCIAVPPAVMRRLLPHLRRGSVIAVMR